MFGDDNLSEEANKMLEQWRALREDLEARKQALGGKDLSNLKLMEAQFHDANLAEADLSGAYLIRANLARADLTEADLTGAVLAEADLKGANLKDAELMDAWLNGADLTGALNLTCDQIELANLDRETRLPDYLKITWTSDTEFTCCE